MFKVKFKGPFRLSLNILILPITLVMECSQCGRTLPFSHTVCPRCRYLGVCKERNFINKALHKVEYTFSAIVVLTVTTFFLWNYDFIPRKPKKEIIVNYSPLQTAVSKESWSYKGFRFTPLFRYRIKGRVLARSHYKFSQGAGISPLDLSLGWGPMSDIRILNRFNFTSGFRKIYYLPEDPSLLEIARSSLSNNHLIPSDDTVKSILLQAEVDDVVLLDGYLVEINKEEGDGFWYWRSSTKRDDDGNGACEVMWVEHAEIE